MSLPLKLNFSDYDNFLTDPNYTTSAEAQDYFRNMDMLVEALIDVGLWQPETNYPNGHVVFSPNMPNGAEAVCVATNGGKSSNTEPSWGEVGGDNVSDGTCFWKLRYKHWSKENASNRLPNTSYAVGDVMLHKSNLSVAIKCTTAGVSSNTELDISTVSVGESVADGGVVWEVVSRDTVATIDKERPIKTFTSLEQLGLDNNATIEDIAETLPQFSMFFLDTRTSNSVMPNLGLTEDELIVVRKTTNSNTVAFRAYGRVGNKSYYGTYTTWAYPKFSGWKQLATNGALSMPSNAIIEVNKGTADNFYNVYIAPCDGWFCLTGHFAYYEIRSPLLGYALHIGDRTPTSATYKGGYIPLGKGQSVHFMYSGGSVDICKFIYAQSEG